MNTIKIALCYSGLVNTWEYLNTHYKFTKLFPSADNFDINVFIHSWDIEQNKINVNKFKSDLEKHHEVNSVNVTITPYKEFDDYINWKGIENVFLTSKIRDQLGIEEQVVHLSLSDDKKEILRYKFAQFWSQWQCFDMLTEDHDLVVRIRPDVNINRVMEHVVTEKRFPKQTTFEDYMSLKNDSTGIDTTIGIRSLDNLYVPNHPVVFVDLNQGDMGVSKYGSNMADWCWYMAGKDFKNLRNKFNDTEHFLNELVTVYLQMEDDMEDHGVPRVLCKVLIDHGAIVYPWPVLETSLEWVYNGK